MAFYLLYLNFQNRHETNRKPSLRCVVLAVESVDLSVSQDELKYIDLSDRDLKSYRPINYQPEIFFQSE